MPDYDCMPILIGMYAVKHDYHTISETGSNAIAMRKAKPSAGLIWNAIRAALRWPLRIIGIIMFIMGAYVYNAVHEYTVNNIILLQVIGCSALFIITVFIAFMLGRRSVKNKNHAGKSRITAGGAIELVSRIIGGIVDLIRRV